MNYTNLHVHSEFSLLDGAAKLVSLAKNAKELGQTYLGLTDHGSVSGARRFKNACEDEGIKPIYGCELYMIEDFSKLPKTKGHNLHLTVLAKNQRGFEKIVKGLHYSNTNGIGKAGRNRRAFMPVTYPLDNGWAGDVVVLSGCASSVFYNLEIIDSIDLIGRYHETFKDDFYAECMPLDDWSKQQEINSAALSFSKVYDIRPVVTNDIHYCGAEDSDLHEIVLCIGNGSKWNDPKRWRFSTHRNHFRTYDDIHTALVKMGVDPMTATEMLETTNEIAEECSFEMAPYAIELPSPIKETDEAEYLTDLWMSGLKKIGKHTDSSYLVRAKYEHSVISGRQFIRYMLIVWDVVRWAKANDIMIGPGRGSVGGSLIAYLLGITEIDPLVHKLSFERFIAPDRNDLPDIDIDIEDSKRNLIESYLVEKYGPDRVCRVAAYQSILGKSAIRDVSRVFDVPYSEADEFSKSIIKPHESDARAHNTVEDTLPTNRSARFFQERHPDVIRHAIKIEGMIRGVGTHAAGIVISNTPIEETGRTYVVSDKEGIKSLNWDKDDLESQGFLKLDLLGLSTLSVISECRRILRQKGVSLDLVSIPLDDAATYETISSGKTAALFQIMTPGATNYCRELQPREFRDLAALTALWRPGPIGAGMAKAYIEVKHGRIIPQYLNDIHKTIVEDTRGQLIYQEQITKLLELFAGFTVSEADKVRKIMGKSLGTAQIAQYESKFVSGCVEKGSLSKDDAKSLWDRLGQFSLYAFNATHATEYGLITYWTAYLKTHYPTEYICAYLNCGSTGREYEDSTNLDMVLRETDRLGVTILPPDINESLDSWTVVSKNALRAGLQEIRNVGEKARVELRKVRQLGLIKSVTDLSERVDKRSLNRRVLKSMVSVGAFDGTMSPDESKAWKCNFDSMFDAAPEARAAIILSSKINADVKIDSSNLNYDLAAVGSTARKLDNIVAILGGGYKRDGYSIIQNLDGSSWDSPDILAAHMEHLAASVISEISIDPVGLVDSTKSCCACDLRLTCKAPVPIEKGKLNVMIVAEAPGALEDKMGRPLVGDSGKLLFSTLADIGIPRNMVWIDNAVHCRPPNNKLDSFERIDGCRHLGESLRIVKPILVLALGNKAQYVFTGAESGAISRNGTTEWNDQYDCFVSYCVHPASVLYDRNKSMEPFQKGLNEFARAFLVLSGATYGI